MLRRNNVTLVKACDLGNMLDTLKVRRKIFNAIRMKKKIIFREEMAKFQQILRSKK